MSTQPFWTYSAKRGTRFRPWLSMPSRLLSVWISILIFILSFLISAVVLLCLLFSYFVGRSLIYQLIR